MVSMTISRFGEHGTSGGSGKHLRITGTLVLSMDIYNF